LLVLPLDHVVSPVATVAVPLLSRLAHSPERYRAAYIRTVEKVAALTMPGMVVMIVCSDWLIQVMLGPQWVEAGVMFTFLGLAGLTQPVSSSCGWLWMTQGRGGEMLRWGLCGGGLAVLSIIVGLPWGAVGVAASYGISGLVLRAPLLYWYVGRRGPVRTRDIYRAMAPAAAASAATGAALVLYRLAAEPTSPHRDLIVSLGVGLATAVLASLVMPTGRRLMGDAWSLLSELHPASSKP
jgi:PST family polysaccharide transporter